MHNSLWITQTFRDAGWIDGLCVGVNKSHARSETKDRVKRLDILTLQLVDLESVPSNRQVP